MIYDFFLCFVVLSVLTGVIYRCYNIKPNWLSWVCILLLGFIGIVAFISGWAAFMISLFDDDVIFWKEWIAQAKELIEGGS